MSDLTVGPEDSPLAALGHHPANYTGGEADVVRGLAEAFEASLLPLAQRLQAFPRHVRRQDIARFLVKHELFRLALPVNGSVVECGVFAGGGLMSWVHFSAIHEPYNHSRRVIGFDTFDGFPSVASQDTATGTSAHLTPGGLRTTAPVQEELHQLATLHDRNRPLGHIPKVELVAGDACQTVAEYVQRNPHLLVSLLYLDFDLYAPTAAALEVLYPRIPRGGVVAFDELNCADFPGETTALLGALDLSAVRLLRFPWDPYISYFVKE